MGKKIYISMFLSFVLSVHALLVPPYAISDQNLLTFDKFNQIKVGMTYVQVVDIVGEEGVLGNEKKFGQNTEQVYQWVNTAGTKIISIGFKNGLVLTKSQIGLDQNKASNSASKNSKKKSKAQVTYSNFNKIMAGMSLPQVEEIMGGEGELMSEAPTGKNHMQTWMWKGGGSKVVGIVSVVFMGGRVAYKTQNGLDKN